MSRKKKIIYILLCLFAAALVFHAALFIVGMKTENFQRWAGEQYFGEIVEISGKEFNISDRDNSKSRVFVTDKTVFKRGPKTVADDLRIGDRVIVFGSLGREGKIEARLIRVFPPGEGLSPPKFFQLPF